MVQPTLLPCKHGFCVGCTRASLTQSKWQCPVCRAVPPSNFRYPLCQSLAKKLKSKANLAEWQAREIELGIKPKEEEQKTPQNLPSQAPKEK